MVQDLSSHYTGVDNSLLIFVTFIPYLERFRCNWMFWTWSISFCQTNDSVNQFNLVFNPIRRGLFWAWKRWGGAPPTKNLFESIFDNETSPCTHTSNLIHTKKSPRSIIKSQTPLQMTSYFMTSFFLIKKRFSQI